MQLIAMSMQDIYLTGPIDMSMPDGMAWTCAPIGVLSAEMNNNTCPITLTEINEEVEFGTCDTCQYNISFSALADWLSVKNECPCCRSIWTNYVKYFIQPQREIARQRLRNIIRQRRESRSKR